MKTFTLSLFIACLAFGTVNAQIKVVATGDVGIKTTTPARPLEVVGQIMSSNFNTYPQNKQSNFLMRHHNDAATHFAYFNASSDVNNNQVLFGGGAGSQYAATNVAFMTGANNTTLLGTERARFNNQGRMRISSTGGGITHDLTVYGALGASKPGGGDWAATSDRRLKTGVREFTDGLEQVLQIEPVFFKYKDIGPFSSREEYVGVIAQDMQQVAPYTVKESQWTQEPGEADDGIPATILTYDGTAVRYMLVNAVQEQQVVIEDQQAQIDDLETRLAKLEAMLSNATPNPGNSAIVNEQTVVMDGLDKPALNQNAPNPFNENTSITYYLPKDATDAYLQVFDVNGSVLKNVPLNAMEGLGKLEVKAGELTPGTYVYSLVVNGQIVDTKKMTMTN